MRRIFLFFHNAPRWHFLNLFLLWRKGGVRGPLLMWEFGHVFLSSKDPFNFFWRAWRFEAYRKRGGTKKWREGEHKKVMTQFFKGCHKLNCKNVSGCLFFDWKVQELSGNFLLWCLVKGSEITSAHISAVAWTRKTPADETSVLTSSQMATLAPDWREWGIIE